MKEEVKIAENSTVIGSNQTETLKIGDKVWFKRGIKGGEDVNGFKIIKEQIYQGVRTINWIGVCQDYPDMQVCSLEEDPGEWVYPSAALLKVTPKKRRDNVHYNANPPEDVKVAEALKEYKEDTEVPHNDSIKAKAPKKEYSKEYFKASKDLTINLNLNKEERIRLIESTIATLIKSGICYLYVPDQAAYIINSLFPVSKN